MPAVTVWLLYNTSGSVEVFSFAFRVHVTASLKTRVLRSVGISFSAPGRRRYINEDAFVLHIVKLETHLIHACQIAPGLRLEV